MKIDINKKDLWNLRNAITEPYLVKSILLKGDNKRVLAKFVRKLNRVIREVRGHDCNGSSYLKILERR